MTTRNWIHRSTLSALLGLLVLSAQTTQAQSSYTIDTASSYIRVITDKGGIAAAAAHQHIVSINNIVGEANYSSEGHGDASFIIRPQDFVVDDDAERALFPDVFKKKVSDKAIRGTKKNMLGQKLLHAAKFPEIKVNIKLASLNGESANYVAEIAIKNELKTLTIPGTLVFTGEQLRATATFNAANPDLGLKIFSALLGTISVGHELKFMVDIVANKATPTSTQ